MNPVDIVISLSLLLVIGGYYRFYYMPHQVRRKSWGTAFLALEEKIRQATCKEDMDVCIELYYQFNNAHLYMADSLYRGCLKHIIRMIQRKYHYYNTIPS